MYAGNVSALFDYQVETGFRRIGLFAQLGNFEDRLAFVLLVLRFGENRTDDAFPAAMLVDVLGKLMVGFNLIAKSAL
jgi:hypothetical protein